MWYTTPFINATLGLKKCNNTMQRRIKKSVPMGGSRVFLFLTLFSFLMSIKLNQLSKGAFFWGYSGYSYSCLGITEYTEFQF